jgi:lambda repressor-like predicted transcriptional regulator
MKRDLTEAELQRLGLVKSPTMIDRGWTKEQIKDAIKELGFSVAGLEKALGVAPRSINQSLQRRSVSSDKAIAAFLNVHESVIWPNRYFVNGVAINKIYNIETRSDEELATLNAEFLKPRKITVIHDWYGTDGGPTITVHDDVKPLTVVENDDKLKNADGTVDHPFYSQPIHPDVSPMADERRVVKLPTGMKIL